MRTVKGGGRWFPARRLSTLSELLDGHIKDLFNATPEKKKQIPRGRKGILDTDFFGPIHSRRE